jgi:hypothetical protein
MIIKTVTETFSEMTSQDFAKSLCSTTPDSSDLIKLIMCIAEEVGDYNFDREMIDYFNYHQDILMSITEGSL